MPDRWSTTGKGTPKGVATDGFRRNDGDADALATYRRCAFRPSTLDCLAKPDSLSEHGDRIQRRPGAARDGNWAGREQELPAVFPGRSVSERFEIHVVEDVHAETGNQ